MATKIRISRAFVKRTLLTGGIVTPTGLLIDHWLNDKQPEQQEPILQVIGGGALIQLLTMTS